MLCIARSQYDKAGREVATWRDEQSTQGERFDYLPNGQLKAARYNATQVWTGTPANESLKVDYAYTPDGLNRQSVTENGAVTSYGYGANALNQITTWGSQTASYDGNFNFGSMGGWQYSYDADKRLTGLDTGYPRARFVYDGLGRCVKRTIDGVTRVITYDDWKPIMEWSDPTHLVAWNAYGPGPDEILWRYQAGAGHLRYHSDMHGNVTALLDYGGTVIEKYTYDAFGRPTVTNGDGTGTRGTSNYGNRFMFTGREYFPELGLYDYRHRFYDPWLGRFLQTDPTGFDAGDMNLFRYCADDPVDKSDPTGLQENSIGGWEGDGARISPVPSREQVNKPQELDSRGGYRNIPREQAEHEMSPSGPLPASDRALLDNGCNGLTSVYQGKGERWPENAPETKAYLDQSRAHNRVVGDNQRNFVFAKQGHWRTTRPQADTATGEVLRTSITSDKPYNYMVYMPTTRSYAWMDHGAKYGAQNVRISNVPNPNSRAYPETIWLSTPIDK
jgi:RHS repeat-associated protein